MSKQALKLALKVIMTLFSIKIHCQKGCRAVESHVFSGFHLQGWIHFKYLCKCVSELKCDLVLM